LEQRSLSRCDQERRRARGALAAPGMKVALISPAYPPMPGGVSDHTRRLAQALIDLYRDRDGEALGLTVVTRSTGVSASASGPAILTWDGDWTGRGVGSLARVISELGPDVAIVQYVPHMYGAHGLALSAVQLVTSLRARGVSVIISAHELYYGRQEGWKYQPFGIAQRVMLVPLVAASARVVVTLADRLARMQHAFPFWTSRFSLIPIGSNFNPRPLQSASEKKAWLREHSIPDAALHLLFLGLAHPSKELATLRRTLEVLLDRGVDARLILVGGCQLEHPRAHSLGFVSAADAELTLSVADLYLLPLADGASTRRGSLMSALAAGLPVVSTSGPNTDTQQLRPDSIRLVPAGDAELFAAAALELALDSQCRLELAARGRELYEQRFSWPVIAGQWRDELRRVVVDATR
jgi:glycosyltransferase involved in cell wall biosynthesis